MHELNDAHTCHAKRIPQQRASMAFHHDWDGDDSAIGFKVAYRFGIQSLSPYELNDFADDVYGATLDASNEHAFAAKQSLG